MPNPFKKKPVRQPVILTVDQLVAVLELHSFAGNFWTPDRREFTVCGCGVQLLGSGKELARHIAVEIAKQQI